MTFDIQVVKGRRGKQVNWSLYQDISVTGPALIEGDATINLCIEWSVALAGNTLV